MSKNPHFSFFKQDQGFGLLMGKLQAALDADAFTNDAVVKYVRFSVDFIVTAGIFLLLSSQCSYSLKCYAY